MYIYICVHSISIKVRCYINYITKIILIKYIAYFRNYTTNLVR